MPISPRKGWLARFASAVRLTLVAVLLTGPGASSAALFRDAADTAAPVVALLSGSLAARMITAAGLGALSVLATQGTALANAPYDDEFNSSTLDPKWSWVRESPANWSLSAVPGSMQMNTQGDIYGTSNTAPVLLQTAPTGDYQVTTHVTANPSFSAKYEQAGLVLYGDDGNYVRLT